ncbi:MAG: response regulator transcription factor [Actinomycetota bacterium]|nr:response regulator transcription factor [Actinomycetota bacterium]
MIRLVLADDEQLTRGAVAARLGMESDLQVVGEASTGAEALAAIRTHKPDIAILDVEMPDGDGAQVTERVTAEFPATRCIILTRHARPGVLRRALAVGAAGFVAKTVPATTLAQIIRRVHRGGRYVDPDLAMTALDTEDCPLTDRELEVLAMVARGLSNAEIAEQLTISPATAKTHVAHLLTKLDARDRIQLLIIAYQCGLGLVLVRDGTGGPSERSCPGSTRRRSRSR